MTTRVKVDDASLKKALTKLNRRINKNIEYVILNEALPHLIDLIMEGYDRLSERANTLPEDPTNPSNWREEFRELLETDMYETISVQEGRISVKVGNKDALGYTASGDPGDPSDTSDLVWLVYYLEGLAGDWAFITPELYSKFRGGANFADYWGRFGQGFMISREQFDEEGWGRIVSFDSVRHPFSGFAPLDIFAEAAREFQIRPFIEKAIRAAAQGREL